MEYPLLLLFLLSAVAFLFLQKRNDLHILSAEGKKRRREGNAFLPPVRFLSSIPGKEKMQKNPSFPVLKKK